MNKLTKLLPCTEDPSLYHDLEKMSVKKVLQSINKEDKQVAHAVEKVLPVLEKMIPLIVERFKKGGRLFYIGAGTSGRLGVLDASEIPPTYGFPPDKVIGIIAGGDKALRKSIENAEDSKEQGWHDLQKYKVNTSDTVIGIAASGNTPYVAEALKHCKSKKILTAIMTSNPQSVIIPFVHFAIITEVGPEFVTGSTRMKSGTAQKMVLNMISTSLMIQLGRVKGNKMVRMQTTNNKLVDRAARMLEEALHISQSEAKKLLQKGKSVEEIILEKTKKK